MGLDEEAACFAVRHSSNDGNFGLQIQVDILESSALYVCQV